MQYYWFRMKYFSNTMANKLLYHTIAISFSMVTRIIKAKKNQICEHAYKLMTRNKGQKESGMTSSRKSLYILDKQNSSNQLVFYVKPLLPICVIPFTDFCLKFTKNLQSLIYFLSSCHPDRPPLARSISNGYTRTSFSSSSLAVHVDFLS